MAAVPAGATSARHRQMGPLPFLRSSLARMNVSPKDAAVTHWLNHSLVLASDYRVPDPERVAPLLERRQNALADLGAHHVLVYASTTDPGRVLVDDGHPRPRDRCSTSCGHGSSSTGSTRSASRTSPHVFAGELVERIDLVGEAAPTAPEVMVSIVTPVEDVTALIAHVHVHTRRPQGRRASESCWCSAPSTTRAR